jgi:hypothetical protein
MATPSKSASSSAYSSLKKAVAQRAAQKRTFHFFVRVTDEQGNVILGAKL